MNNHIHISNTCCIRDEQLISSEDYDNLRGYEANTDAFVLEFKKNLCDDFRYIKLKQQTKGK